MFQQTFLFTLGDTHHIFENGSLTTAFIDQVVPGRLPAVHHRLFRLGPPGVGRPTDTGEQSRGSPDRVVARAGRLLVPSLDGMARNEHGDANAHHGESNGPFHHGILWHFYAAVWRGILWALVGSSLIPFLLAFQCSKLSLLVDVFWVFQKVAALYIGAPRRAIVTLDVRQSRS